MVTARFVTTVRTIMNDGDNITVEIVSPDGRSPVTFLTDTAGVVCASNHLERYGDAAYPAYSFAISQPLVNWLRVEILDDETEEGEYDALIAWLKAIFRETNTNNVAEQQ